MVSEFLLKANVVQNTVQYSLKRRKHNTALKEGNIAKEHLTTELTQAMPNSATESQ